MWRIISRSSASLFPCLGNGRSPQLLRGEQSLWTRDNEDIIHNISVYDTYLTLQVYNLILILVSFPYGLCSLTLCKLRKPLTSKNTIVASRCNYYNVPLLQQTTTLRVWRRHTLVELPHDLPQDASQGPPPSVPRGGSVRHVRYRSLQTSQGKHLGLWLLRAARHSAATAGRQPELGLRNTRTLSRPAEFLPKAEFCFATWINVTGQPK